MGIMDTYGWKFKPEIPYLTAGEQGMFKKLVEAQAISSFRMSPCEVCEKDVPKGKRFCSKQCYEKWQQQQEKADA